MIPAKKNRLFVAWFARHVEKRIRRRFFALRVRGLDPLRTALENGPVLVVSNHSAWWDPMFAIYLTYRVLRADGYAMMDAANLRRLPFLGRVGGFGVDLEDPEDRKAAVAHAASLLTGPGRLVWIYPQGSERPAAEGIRGFKPGAARIAACAQGCAVIPLAIGYAFGAGELPEALLSFGPPIGVNEDVESARAAQEDAVRAEMERIERFLIARDENAGFTPLVRSVPSLVSRIAERLLALLTRYRGTPRQSS